MLQSKITSQAKDGKLLIIVMIIGLLLFIPIMYNLHQEDERSYQTCIQNHNEKYCANTIYGIY